MEFLWKATKYISEKLKICAAFCMMAMTIVTCIDVVGRFFKHPLFGSVEIVTFLATIVTAFGLAYTQELKGHIGVELVYDRLPKKLRAVIAIFTDIVSFIMFIVITKYMFSYGMDMKKAGEVSMNLKFPEYFIVILVGFALVIFSLTIMKSIFDHFRELKN